MRCTSPYRMHRINRCNTLPHKEKVQLDATDKEEPCLRNIASVASVPDTLVAHTTLSAHQMQDLDKQIAALTVVVGGPVTLESVRVAVAAVA